MTWHQVSTLENPADIFLRGATPEKVINSELWWKGPSWLPNPSEWPKSPVQGKDEIPRFKRDVVTMVAYVAPTVLSRFQHYGKLQQVIGYCIRFIDNYISKKTNRGPLTAEELERANCFIVRVVQRECFPSELKYLKVGKDIDKTSD